MPVVVGWRPAPCIPRYFVGTGRSVTLDRRAVTRKAGEGVQMPTRTAAAQAELIPGRTARRVDKVVGDLDAAPDHSVQCWRCWGKGHYTVDGGQAKGTSVSCDLCHGTGRITRQELVALFLSEQQWVAENQAHTILSQACERVADQPFRYSFDAWGPWPGAVLVVHPGLGAGEHHIDWRALEALEAAGSVRFLPDGFFVYEPAKGTKKRTRQGP